VYEAWKDVNNQLLRGYTNCGFEAWTVPCLYIVGKYLRVFAIKADLENVGSTGAVTNFGDDNFEPEKNEKLEDAARQLNRVFQICLSDRYAEGAPTKHETMLTLCRAAIEDSRKWAIYDIINLLFKTYFKLNAISLSKNILKAIQAYQGEMPELHQFPQAHQVTFKYYIGVIYFLEENYVEVCLPIHPIKSRLDSICRPKRTSQKPGRCATMTLSEIKSTNTNSTPDHESHSLQ
jgi:hypothetical protein